MAEPQTLNPKSPNSQPRLATKEKKLARMTVLNDALMKQMRGLESSMHAKEDTLRAQNEIITELSEQKKRLQDENASLTKRCISYSEREDKAWRLNKLQAERMGTLWAFAQMLSMSLLEDGAVSPEVGKQTIGFVYRDLIRARALMAGASLKLQKVMRGHLGRKAFRRTGRPHGIPLPVAWDAAVASAKRGTARSAIKANKDRGGAGRFVPLEDLKMLVKSLLLLPDGVHRLTSTPNLLRHASSQVSIRLRSDVEEELSKFSNALRQTSDLIVEGLRGVGVSENSVSCQAGTTLSGVPHLKPSPHVDRPVGTPWVGAWAQPAIYVKRHVLNQVALQTPGDDQWSEVKQAAWARPGFGPKPE